MGEGGWRRRKDGVGKSQREEGLRVKEIGGSTSSWERLNGRNEEKDDLDWYNKKADGERGIRIGRKGSERDEEKKKDDEVKEWQGNDTYHGLHMFSNTIRNFTCSYVLLFSTIFIQQ